MENWNILHDFPRCPSFFLNNRLPSRVYIIRCSSFHSCLCQRQSSNLIKLLGLIATVRCLLDGHKSTFGFVVLPFVGVVLFLSSPFVGVVLFPSSATLWSWAREHVRRGRRVECFKSRFLCYSSPPLFFPFLASLLSFFHVVFALIGCLLIVIF